MSEMNTKVSGKSNNARCATFLLVYFLGVSTVLGGHFSSWNKEGMTHGFWSFFIAVVVMASAYICLVLSLCEMTAALPFSGGTYGLARATLGQFSGYILGSFEMIEYLIYIMLAAHSFGSMLTLAAGTSRAMEPCWWLLFYLSSMALQLVNKQRMWSFAVVFGITTLVLLLLYCCVATPVNSADFELYSGDDAASTDPGAVLEDWLRCLPFAAWFFVGIETLPMASGEALQANKTIPKAILAVIATAVVSSIVVLSSAASMAPGANSTEFQRSLFPLSFGFSALFDMSVKHAVSLSIVAKYFTGFGFMYASARQVSAMQKSGLLLTFFTKRMGDKRSLERGYVVGSILSYCTLLGVWWNHEYCMEYFERACLLANFVVCLGILSSYVVFRHKFSSLIKNHKSPLGVYGATYSAVVFIVAFVSLAGLQSDGGKGLLVLAVLIGLMAVRYLMFNYGHVPVVSNEEQSVLFVAYVINSNISRRQQNADRQRSVRELNSSKRDLSIRGSRLARSTSRRISHPNTNDSSNKSHATHNTTHLYSAKTGELSDTAPLSRETNRDEETTFNHKKYQTAKDEVDCANLFTNEESVGIADLGHDPSRPKLSISSSNDYVMQFSERDLVKDFEDHHLSRKQSSATTSHQQLHQHPEDLFSVESQSKMSAKGPLFGKVQRVSPNRKSSLRRSMEALAGFFSLTPKGLKLENASYKADTAANTSEIMDYLEHQAPEILLDIGSNGHRRTSKITPAPAPSTDLNATAGLVSDDLELGEMASIDKIEEGVEQELDSPAVLTANEKVKPVFFRAAALFTQTKQKPATVLKAASLFRKKAHKVKESCSSEKTFVPSGEEIGSMLQYYSSELQEYYENNKLAAAADGNMVNTGDVEEGVTGLLDVNKGVEKESGADEAPERPQPKQLAFFKAATLFTQTKAKPPTVLKAAALFRQKQQKDKPVAALLDLENSQDLSILRYYSSELNEFYRHNAETSKEGVARNHLNANGAGDVPRLDSNDVADLEAASGVSGV